MKIGRKLRVVIVVILLFMSVIELFPQEVAESKISVAADIYSSYIWRGTKYGTGPAIQPAIKYNGDILTVGAWGSFDFNGYQEADLYFNILLPAGFNVGLSDYYYPDLDYFDYSKTSGSHAFEINAGFQKGNIYLSANYIFNKAGGAASLGGDKYFRVEYSIRSYGLFIGAGDGWHTYDPEAGEDKFAVCDLGLTASKKIKINDSFNIPLTGQVIFNPDKQRMYIVAGFSFEVR